MTATTMTALVTSQPSPWPPRPRTDVLWTPREVGWERLEATASPLVGITTRLFDQLHDVDDIRMASVGAQACESQWLLGTACNELNGGGAPDPRQARAAAIGETIERYSGSWVDPTQLHRASHAELTDRGVNHVTPQELRLFSEEQLRQPGFRFAPFEASTQLDWIPGVDLARDTTVLVPAQLMYLTNGILGDTRIGYSTSNGMACGCTWEEAVLSGLLEVVERDAFMATWYGRLSLPQIAPDSDAELARFLQEHVGHSGLDVSLVNMSVLVDVPVVLAVIRNSANGIAPLALGAACSASPLTAARKAVIEAFQTRTWAKAEQREGAVLDPVDGFDQVKDFDDHVRLSLHPEAVRNAAFLDSSTNRVSLADLPEVPARTPGQAIREIAWRLARQDIRVMACDMTSPDVAEAGLVVAKAFAPGLSPLDSGYPGRMLGGRRLRERAAAVGLLDHPLDEADLNPWPHPFP